MSMYDIYIAPQTQTFDIDIKQQARTYDMSIPQRDYVANIMISIMQIAIIYLYEVDNMGKLEDIDNTSLASLSYKEVL